MFIKYLIYILYTLKSCCTFSLCFNKIHFFNQFCFFFFFFSFPLDKHILIKFEMLDILNKINYLKSYIISKLVLYF